MDEAKFDTLREMDLAKLICLTMDKMNKGLFFFKCSQMIGEIDPNSNWNLS